MGKKINVFIVDDHQIIIDGLINMMNTTDDICCIGSAVSGKEALDKVKRYKPDIVISDISMPDINGVELTQELKKLMPEIKILILSMYTNEEFIFSVIRAGALGVLPKQDTDHKTLLDAIRTINAGSEYFGQSVSKIIMKSLYEYGKTKENPENFTKFILTQREKEILKLYVEGYSNQEIANHLHISIRTVETHKNNIMQKFNFKNTVEMVKFAIRNNIVSI